MSLLLYYSYPFQIDKTSDPYSYSSNIRFAFTFDNIHIRIRFRFKKMKTDIERTLIYGERIVDDFVREALTTRRWRREGNKTGNGVLYVRVRMRSARGPRPRPRGLDGSRPTLGSSSMVGIERLSLVIHLPP
jgi:hypothetical protein